MMCAGKGEQRRKGGRCSRRSFGLTSILEAFINHQMMTVKQFAEKVGKSRQRVHQLMREGRIRPMPKRVGFYFLLASNARITKSLTTVK